jgi:uncharacterized protein YcgL (UPF0745 family)
MIGSICNLGYKLGRSVQKKDTRQVRKSINSEGFYGRLSPFYEII